MLVGLRAHEAYGNTVRIFDDGVSSAPECVVGWLQSVIARAGQIGIALVDGFARRETKTDDDTAGELRASAPSSIPYPRKRDAVDLQIYGLRVPRAFRAGMVSSRRRAPDEMLGYFNAEAPIELE